MKLNNIFYTLKVVIFLFIIGSTKISQAQVDYGWDNQIYLGNKITFGKNEWKFSGELQTRMKDDFQSLDNWYIEFVSNYFYSERIEIVPDFRYTIKPGKFEFRPGIGILYKKTIHNVHYVNQIKYQMDISTLGDISHAFREVIFLNYPFNDKIVGTTVAGFIYKKRSNWNGFQYIRVGPGVTYLFDQQHSLNFSYFIGVENKTDGWLWAGIPMVQLVISISNQSDYKYMPAYYFNF